MPGRVLLVEPDTALAEVLVQVLNEVGYDCLRCRSVVDVGAAATGQRGELAILDTLHVPGLLAEEHRYALAMLSRVVPLVLLVDDRSQGDLLAEDLGVAAVLTKPFDLDRLQQAVEVASAAPSALSRP